MPPMRTFPAGEAWKKGFDALGMRLTRAAVGINSTEFKGRPACIYDGWCHVGCPIGALSNPLVTYLADARKAGADVRPFASVARVLTSADGAKATGVEYYDANNKSRFRRQALSFWLRGRRRTLASCSIR